MPFHAIRETGLTESDSPYEELSVEEKKVKDFFKMVLPWCVGGVFLIGDALLHIRH